MSLNKNSDHFITIEPEEGLYLHMLPDSRFNRTYISVFLSFPLRKEQAAETAIIPRLLVRGAKEFPTTPELKKKLAGLYGGSLSAEVSRIGDKQAVRLNLELTSDYAAGQPILDQGLTLLSGIVRIPYLPCGYFDRNYVEQEKVQQISRLLALHDDKERWAVRKAFEALFEGEAFNIYEEGDLEGVKAISAETLTKAYSKAIHNRLDIYLAGAFNPSNAADMILSLFGGTRRSKAISGQTTAPLPSAAIRRVEIEEPSAQSWAVLGMKSGIPLNSPDHWGLYLTCILLGGNDQSRLFRIIRETAGLSYECGTIFDPSTGVILARAGVDKANLCRAADIMLTEIDKISKGNIDYGEYTIARESLSGILRSAMDDPGELIKEHYIGIAEGVCRDIRAMNEAISKISIDDVVRSAHSIKPDTLLMA